jgi:ferredoxin
MPCGAQQRQRSGVEVSASRRTRRPPQRARGALADVATADDQHPFAPEAGGQEHQGAHGFEFATMAGCLRGRSAPVPSQPLSPASMTFTITVQPSGRTFSTDPGEAMLAAGIRQGIGLPYGCKDGACGSCKCKLSAAAWSTARTRPRR